MAINFYLTIKVKKIKCLINILPILIRKVTYMSDVKSLKIQYIKVIV